VAADCIVSTTVQMMWKHSWHTHGIFHTADVAAGHTSNVVGAQWTAHMAGTGGPIGR
jgi:hypothetical protein